MFRRSRLLLAPVAAVALLAFSPGTASAAPAAPPLPTDLLQDVVTSLVPSGPQEPAPPAPGAGSADSQGAGSPLDVLPLPTGEPEDAEQTPVESQEAEDVAPAETPNPAAELCAQLEDGLGAPTLPAALTGPLSELVGELCALAEQDPLAELQELLEGLLAQLPSLTDPAAGCAALIGFIEQGADALGLDPTPLTDVIETICALIPGTPTPGPTPTPQPQPQPAAHPVVQPQQHPQPVAAPVAHTAPAASGQLAYTGTEPVPYLAGGVAALGLGTMLQLAGRRRRVSSDN